MADVFVSYAHADHERVRPLSGAVEESGRSLWWDERLLPSDDYALVIEDEIAAAGCVVVAWSGTARQSLWVRAEANEALDAGKLVQLTLDGAKLPLPFGALHFLDFRRWGGERGGSPWAEFDARVDAMLRGERPAEEPSVREPPLQGLGPAVALGWAVLALAALIAIAVIAAAAGALSGAAFGAAAGIALALAAVLLGAVGFIAARIFAASRR